MVVEKGDEQRRTEVPEPTLTLAVIKKLRLIRLIRQSEVAHLVLI